ncbi:hypothetical protein SAMN04488134_11651 [Amphibacillus marinus]|uniref:DUF7695 domain-containing protein n=1 Tax=Amphibacillus marinus TaxID=872970 RepID=A0A1H8THZ9_9BACI|nr:hypothetical protein [Amphibacillus marinus]SEO90431.1 hypothetical protein SAMN04488134_11651 [Amphibacillus marinus]
MKRVVKNIVTCKKCKDTIESKHRHDFQRCKCGAITTDGGTDYQKVSWPSGGAEEDYIDFNNSIYL